MFRWLGGLLALALILSHEALRAGEPKPASASAEQLIPNFHLKDFQGKEYALDDFREQPIVVVAFLGVECPLAKLYGPRLNELATHYGSKGVAVLGIDSNSQDSLSEMACYARTHQITFPLLKDPTGAVAQRLGATRTPEVFVLDQRRAVRYHGRIDDQYARGSTRPEARQSDLRQSLDELLAGKAVSQPSTEPQGCLIGARRKIDEKSAVTYTGQIAALLKKRCVECHQSGQIAPFSLTDYEEVVGWADMIGEVVEEERMPPWHANPKIGRFAGDRRLSAEEKKLIKTWVAAGAPRGKGQVVDESKSLAKADSAAAANEHQDATPEWGLARAPDAVFPMCNRPFKVAAQGLIDYKFYKVETHFKEDRWVSAAELLPGNRAVVHHAMVQVYSGSHLEAILDGSTEGYLAAYVPGMRPSPFPNRMAKRIPAGATLVFQMHYVANGSEQQDISRLGLIFVDPSQVDYEIRTSSVITPKMVIPARAANFRITADSIPAPRECRLMCLMPHMHARGVAFNYELILPTGKTETLLDIPHYDHNWQTAYRLVEPRVLPVGSRLRCNAVYDNSENNPNNPDPQRDVRWGLQAKDEMMVGYFDIAVSRNVMTVNPVQQQAAPAAIRGHLGNGGQGGRGR